MQRSGVTYIIANRRNGTLYTGVTANLRLQIQQHRTGEIPGFTAKYGCKILVWYRAFERIEDAIAEEKRIKGGSRLDKLHLIEEMNPQWNDLWEEVKLW